MNEFDKYKNWFLKNKYFAVIFLGVTALIYAGNGIDSINKIKAEFSAKNDPKTVQVVSNKKKQISNKINIDTLKIKSKIELYDLLKLLIPEKNYCQDWFVGSDCEAISWITVGQGNMNDIDSTLGQHWPYGRSGYSILTYKQENIYNVLKRKKEAGKWNIKLCGPNVGIYRVYIENEYYGRSLEPCLLNKYLPQNCNVKPIPFNKSDSLTFDCIVTDKFLLKIPDRKEIIVYEHHSCGTAGCIITLVLELV